jgi:hypothetical protein
VDRIECDQELLGIVGRCFFGPISTGMIFDGVVLARRGRVWSPSDLVPCRLQIAEIEVFRRLVDEIDPVMSGQLALSGQPPPGLGSDSLLVADGSRDGRWTFRDGVWRAESLARFPAAG